ncbi:MAG: hypothetical protein AAFX94_20035 [Myxococcota bacterium]
MARKESKETKEARRNAETLWARSEEMFAGGDYLTARSIAAEIVATAPGTDLAGKAGQRVRDLGTVDRTGWYALGGAFALYLIGWGFAWV